MPVRIGMYTISMPTKSLSNREYELMLLLVAERTGP